MTYLKQAIQQLDAHLPNLKAELEALTFDEREKTESRVIQLFKAAGGTNLLVDEKYSGQAISPWQAVLIQLAMGSLSPSLAIGVGMHQFSVATLGELARQGRGMESLLLEAISKNNLLVSSAFSEGQKANSILASKIVAKPHKKGFLVSGVKKPCSLSFDMDLLTASVRVEPENGEPYLGVALIHKGDSGLRVEKFWSAPFLQGSQSEAIILDQVYVPHSMLLNIDEASAYQAHINGFVWFELLTVGSYLGMAYGLADYADKKNRLNIEVKAEVYTQLEASALSLKAVALDMASGVQPHSLADILNVRYQTQKVLLEVVNHIIACLGGINYIQDSYPSYIVQTIQALGFHPPGQYAMRQALADWVDSGTLKMV